MRTRLLNVPGFANDYLVARSLIYLSGFEGARFSQVTQNPHTAEQRDFIQVYCLDNFDAEPDFSVEQVGKGRFALNYGASIDERVILRLESRGVRFKHILGRLGLFLDFWFTGLDAYRRTRALVK